ncbi:MAG: HEAT repeat domain-containing protein [Tannerellaceae bacterium]|jgi:HEAT repeat protein|nr:HEAT repeat domain-containing protein [Tannerellaceae bacterium]
MKRIYSLIILLYVLLSVNITALRAQEADGLRVAVAGVLDKLPAATASEYGRQLDVLISMGEEGILMLSDMLRPPGEGDNSKVEYALSGISYYVMAKGDESLRSATATAYIKALEAADDSDIKAFIISLLQVTGKDESVVALARYLGDERLSDPAARALASIGTARATDALRSALLRKLGTPATLSNIVVAIGEIHTPGAANILGDIVTDGDDDLKKAVFYAMGQSGDKSFLGVLSSAVEKVNADWDRTGANEAYITLLKRMAGQGDSGESLKAASALLKKATKEGKANTRNAALEILLSVEKADGLKRIQSAMKDASRQYRNVALDCASDFASREIYVELIKTIAKAKPEAKVDILNWIGRESLTPEKNALIRTLNIRFDLPAVQPILDQLKSDDPDVRQAAVRALVRIGDPSFIPSLANLLTSKDTLDISFGRDALIAFGGDVESGVAHVITAAPDAGKIAAVEVLALRRAHTRINAVLELIKSGSPEVKKAAYAALKDLATEKDMVLLCGMLETADAAAVPSLQRAVTASVSSLPAKDQAQVISRRMLQAGEGAKHLYYVVLSATGDKDALPTIVTGFHQGKGAPKDAAFEALLAWKGAESTDELFAICEDASAPGYFDRSLTAYARAVSANTTLAGDDRYLGLLKAIEIAHTNEQRTAILRQIGRTGSYQALLYAGGLLDDNSMRQAAADAVMNIALNNKSYKGREVIELLNKVSSILGDHGAEYQRENIRKHLEEISKDTSTE